MKYAYVLSWISCILCFSPSLYGQSENSDYAVILHLIKNKEEGTSIFNALVAEHGGKDIGADKASKLITVYGDAMRAHNEAVRAIILATSFKKTKHYKDINSCFTEEGECKDDDIKNILTLIETADDEMVNLRGVGAILAIPVPISPPTSVLGERGRSEESVIISPLLTAIGLVPSLVTMVRAPAIKKREVLIESLKAALWEPVALSG